MLNLGSVHGMEQNAVMEYPGSAFKWAYTFMHTTILSHRPTAASSKVTEQKVAQFVPWSISQYTALNQFNHKHISKNLAYGGTRMWKHIFLFYLWLVCSNSQKASWMLDQEESFLLYMHVYMPGILTPPPNRTSCKQRIGIIKIPLNKVI